MQRYPRCAATIARPTPVLPDVGSTIVPPGRSSPSRSAASIIAIAGRSFTEPPGLNSSSLATRSHARSAPTRPRRTIGVFPTRSSRLSATSTGVTLAVAVVFSAGMQEHHYTFDVDASPEDIWEVFWYHGPDKPMTPGVTIEILHPGDEIGNGLVR